MYILLFSKQIFFTQNVKEHTHETLHLAFADKVR